MTIIMKIAHFIWDKTPMSFLNVCTVLSFLKFHTDWAVNVWILNTNLDERQWTYGAHGDGANWYDYFYLLENNKRIEIKKIDDYHDLKNIKYTSIHLVDYIKYFIIHEYGGTYIDFDILFHDNIQSYVNIVNTTIFYMPKYRKDSYNESSVISHIPNGLLISKKNSLFFRKILNDIDLYYDKHAYNTFGANMFKDIFKLDENSTCESIQLKINTICGELVNVNNGNVYLPIKGYDTNLIFSETDFSLDLLKRVQKSFGIHWFAGATQSIYYRKKLDRKIRKYIKTNIFNRECVVDDLIIDYLDKKISEIKCALCVDVDT